MSGMHHEYSPSKSSRWMNCPGAITMEKDFPDTTSDAAEEGTAAHALAEECLLRKVSAITFLGMHFNGYEVTEDMARFVQSYLDNLDEYLEKPQCD